MDTRFQDKNAIVTGAAGGIGLGLVKALLRRGIRVTMADVAEDRLREAQSTLPEGADTRIAVLDVTDSAAFADLAARTAGSGGLDFLFNNAGLGCAGFLSRLEEETIDRVLDVNLRGVINGCRAAIPYMVRDGGGWIVNTGSLASFTPLAFRTIYNATKYAVLGLTECLRLELDWMESNIHVATACPSTVDTAIWNGIMPPDAITPEEAAEEILLGVERGDTVIPVTDQARRMYAAYCADRPAYNEELKVVTSAYKPLLITPEIARNIAVRSCREPNREP